MGGPSNRNSFTGPNASQPNGAVDAGNGQQQQVRLNTEATRQALSLVNETVSMSAATLQEVQRQAEQLDRIERNVDNIHANLDKSDRLLRGMESIPAYFGNKVWVSLPICVYLALTWLAVVQKGKAATSCS